MRSRLLAAFLLAISLTLSLPASAGPNYLFGRVGDYPVAATLESKADKLDGWYFYTSKGRMIRLEGTLASDGRFHLDELDNGKKTGLLDGIVSNGRWSGSWRKAADSTPLPLELEENPAAPAGQSLNFECTSRDRDKEFSYTYRSQFALNLANGKVKKMVAEQRVIHDSGDDKQCILDFGELTQVPAKKGILLKGTENETPGGRCSIRIQGDERTLWVHFGDSSRNDDDCRGVDDTLFCGSGAMWSDIVIDRKTQKCRLLR